MRFERGGDRGGESVAVHRQRPAGGHLVGVGRAHDQRAEPAHLLMQEADGGLFVVVGAEGIGADQLGQLLGLVGLGGALWAHLVQRHRQPALGDLPGRLGACEAAADNVNRWFWFACQFRVMGHR